MTVLVTGADGYFGRLCAAELLRSTDHPLALWVHARDKDDLEQRRARLLAALGPAAAGRVQIAGGDLTAHQPFAGVNTDDVVAILHTAAATRFNVDSGTAQAVNVGGTEKLLALARRCPRLAAFSQVSSLYASGLRAGGLPEEPLSDEAGFANHYESSKWAAETRVAAADLPWRVLRLPTLIADDDGGRASQRNAFHNTLRLLRAGLLSLVPGRAETPLYFSAGDWAARAAVALTLLPGAGGVYNLSHGRQDALTVSGLLDVAFEVFAADPAFRARRLLRPPLCDRQTFDQVAGALEKLGGPMLTQALGSITPFAPQLFVDKSIDNRRLRAALPGQPPPTAPPLVRAAVAALGAPS